MKVSCALVALCLVAVAAASGDNGFASRFGSKASFDQFVDEGWDSPFGVDYVFVHSPGARDRELVDGICEQVAFRWVNFARLEWGIIEKRAPQNGQHAYDWSDMDRAVRAWQRNGVHIMVSLRFFSHWATAAKDGSEFVYLKGPAKWLAVKGADYLPKPEHRQDYRDYVRNLVERYDGDGRDDMPGLLFPVLHYQVGKTDRVSCLHQGRGIVRMTPQPVLRIGDDQAGTAFEVGGSQAVDGFVVSGE